MAKKVEKAVRVKSKAGNSFFGRHKWELIIFAFSMLLYANSIPNGYNMDDELVTINHRLTSQGVSAIPEIFASTYYKDNSGYAYEYRPMVLVSFALEHQVFGDNPVVSHFFNVLLYALCCLLLFKVMQLVTTGFSILIPLGITLLFIAHPAHTEVVASIKNRDEILGLIFSLLTWWTAFKAVNENGKWFFLMPLFFVAALMSKMSVLPFNLIIPLALILFTGVDFKKLVLVSVLLSVSSFIVFNNLLYEKLIISVAFVVVSMLLFLFIRFSQFSAWFRSFFKSVLTKPNPSLDEDGVQIGASFKANLNDFKSALSLDYKPYLSFRSMSLTFTIAAVYLTAVFIGFPALIIAAGSAFFVLLVFGNEKTIWWANTMLYVCLVFTMVKYTFGDSLYVSLINICLLYQILYGDRKLLVPSVLILIALLCLPNISVLVTYAACGMIFFKWKRTWPLAVLFLASGIYSSCRAFLQPGFLSHAGLYTDKYEVFITCILIASLLLHRGTKILITAFQVLAVVSLLNMNAFQHTLSPKRISTDFKNQVIELGEKVNTNLISEKVDRPISFVEQPVTSKSPMKLRVGTAFEILFIYLHKVVLPYPMSFYYGYRFIDPENITEAVPLAGLLLYILLFLITVFCLKRHKLIGFGLMIYLISIASVSSYFYPIPGQLAERFLFIPSLGWSIVFVVVAGILFKAKIPASVVSIANVPNGLKYSFTALLCLYSVITFSRNFDWKDYSTLSKHDINYVSNSSQANNLVALNLMKTSYEIQDPITQKAMRVEALGHFKKALKIYPGFYNVTYDIARVFNVLNENDSSIYYFKKAFAIDSTNPDPPLFIGQMLVGEGKFAEAIPYLQYVIAHHPADYQPFDRLSFAYFKLQDYERSIAVNQSAIAMLPAQTGPYLNIAHVYLTLNQTDSARTYIQKAAQVNPNDPNVQQMLHQVGR